MPEVLWEEVRGWFEPDGSLLDAYVFETSVADWQAFVDLVRSRGWWFDYLEDNRSTRLPHRVEDVLERRWGSCSPDGSVNLHWAVMQLPPELLDYVLVHELVHLRHHDHGGEFWRRVERTMPDYQARRDRLRRLGPDLWLPGLPEQS